MSKALTRIRLRCFFTPNEGDAIITPFTLNETNVVETTQQIIGYYDNSANPSSPFPMPEHYARIEEALTDGVQTNLDTITELGDDPLSAIRVDGENNGFENNGGNLASAMAAVTPGLNHVYDTQAPYMFESQVTGQLINGEGYLKAMTLIRERIQDYGIPFTSWYGTNANPYQVAMNQFALLLRDSQDPNAKIYDLGAQAADYGVQWD